MYSIVFLSEQTGEPYEKPKGCRVPGLFILLSFFSSGEMVMPKWCEWSFLLELQIELLYLEQPSAAVAYSQFSPRWWHFHNGFFRWISSSSWTFWQKSCDVWGVNWRPNQPVPTAKRTGAAPSKRQGRNGLHWLKSLTCRLTRCVCRCANVIRDEQRILVMTCDDYCWWWLVKWILQWANGAISVCFFVDQFGGCAYLLHVRHNCNGPGSFTDFLWEGIASWMVGGYKGWLMDSNGFCHWSLMKSQRIHEKVRCLWDFCGWWGLNESCIW